MQCFFEIASKLSHVLWRKIAPQQRDDADAHLAGQLIYSLVEQERYQLAALIGDFGAETFKQFASESHKKMLAINRAQAHKWLGNGKACDNILNTQDWSAAKDEFRVCVEALRDNVSEVVGLMKSLQQAKRPGKVGYREWPVFKEVRKTDNFQKAFEEIFGEPLHVVTVDDTKGDSAVPTPSDGADTPDDPTVH